MKLIYSTLTLTLFFFSVTPVTAAKKTPTFFFAGQSNMVGVNNDGRDLSEILHRLTNDQSALLSYLKGAVSSPTTPPEVYQFEATELVALKNRGVISADFSNPLSSVQCSFYELDPKVDYRKSGAAKPSIRANKVAMHPAAKCGAEFGPELGFGHIMDDVSGESFSVSKLAAGGSTLRNNWSKNEGGFWPIVQERLSALDASKEEWKGIVWFQGENDAFDEFKQNSAANYLNDLTQFISDLRNEMYNADTTTFTSAEDIPVVIVQVGCWISTLDAEGALIAESQAGFVKAQENYYASVGKPSRTTLAFTGDLSCHYHFDKASQLIIGTRVAEAIKPLLIPQPTSVVVTTPPPTPSPATPSPTKAPIVAAIPTVAPDLGNSNQGDLFVNLSIKFDDFPEETSWTIEETNTRIKLHWVDPGTYIKNAGETITQKIWLDPIDMTYTLVMKDDFGDGLSQPSGYFDLTRANGDPIAHMTDFNDFETRITFSMTSSGTTPSAAPPPVDPVLAPTESDSYVTLAIQLDSFPEDISWRLVESDTKKTLHWVDTDAYGDQFDQLVIKTLWLKPGSNKSYNLIMSDSHGDGLNDGGYFELTRGNGQRIARVDDFSTAERIVQFQM